LDRDKKYKSLYYPRFAKGKKITIVIKNNSQKNRYIQSAKLNGIDYEKCWIDHVAIAKGGTFELTVGEIPNKKWQIEKQ